MNKDYSVKKSSDIEKIIKKRKSVGNTHFVVYKSENHEETHFRFAVSVPKKFGNAVHRNKIKRQIREIMAKLDVIDKIDVFIVVKKNANELDFEQIKKSITWLMNKQNILR